VSAATERAWRLAGALGGLVVAADQATKAAIEANLVPGEDVHVLGPISLTSAHNTGVAFGLAGGGSGVGIVLLTLAALALIFSIFAREPGRPGTWLAIGLISGGALGNLADRVRADAVTDFVDLPGWPPFNLADTAITLGVATLAWAYLREPPDPDRRPG
jgi:signal peptidase II